MRRELFSLFGGWKTDALALCCLCLPLNFTQQAAYAAQDVHQASHEKVAVRGVVTDANGEPIVGAVVRVIGSNLLTTTDKTGAFALDAVSLKAKLEVS